MPAAGDAAAECVRPALGSQVAVLHYFVRRHYRAPFRWERRRGTVRPIRSLISSPMTANWLRSYSRGNPDPYEVGASTLLAATYLSSTSGRGPNGSSR